jgi:hypothetical protein
MGGMRRRSLFLAPAVACLFLSACTAGTAHHAVQATAPAADPAGYGEHGRYKIPFIVTMGATVTVTIDPPARGHVVISNPYAPAGVTAATYRPCPHQVGFFPQGFAFTDGQIRGCVPLEVKVGGQPQIRRVTLSLFAGSCSG